MSYLAFTDIGAAELRNSLEAFRRQCVPPTVFWWPMTNVNGVYYLDVKDGDGLTDEEKLKVELELPNFSELNNENE